MTPKIFDAQVNYGESLFGPNCKLEEYMANASRIGVSEFLLIPTGTHVFHMECGTVEESCIWSIESGTTVYRRILREGSEQSVQINPKSPYLEFNKETLRAVHSLDNSPFQVYFCPKVHPVLDKPEDLEGFLDDERFVAVKIQTLATYTWPDKIPQWLIDFSREYRKPLLIHTDYANPQATGEEYQVSKDMLQLMKKNNGRNWTEWAVANDIKCVLTHGVRLDRDAIAIVNENNNIRVSTGPDLLLNHEKQRLASASQDYLFDLIDSIDSEKLLFSTDFAWNSSSREDWTDLDWNTIDRIKKVLKSQGKLSKDTYANIMGNNAREFLGVGS